MKSLLILPLTFLLIVGCGEKKAANKVKFGDQVWFGLKTESGQEIIRGEATPSFWYISENENVFKLRQQQWTVGGTWYNHDTVISKRNLNWLTRTDVQRPMPKLTELR